MPERKRQQSAASDRGVPLRRGRAPKADRLGGGRRPAALRRLREAMRANLERPEPFDEADRPPLDTADRPLLDDGFTESGDGNAGSVDGAAACGGGGSVELATAPGGATAADDGLPEYTLYRDGGCHVAPACLSCPLATCIYDRKLSPEQQARRRRNRRIRALARAGWSSARLAERFKLSPAQVRRIRGPRRRKGNG